MSVFKKPLNLAAPDCKELFRGTLNFKEDVEHLEFAPNEMKALVVDNGTFDGDGFTGKVRPIASVAWVTKCENGDYDFDVELTLQPKGLIPISIDMRTYGKDDKALFTLFETNHPRFYTWSHSIAFVHIDELDGNIAKYTCYQIL